MLGIELKKNQYQRIKTYKKFGENQLARAVFLFLN